MPSPSPSPKILPPQSLPPTQALPKENHDLHWLLRPSSSQDVTRCQDIAFVSSTFSASPRLNPQSLVKLDLSANLPEGSITDEIGNLESLSISFNHLSRHVPKSQGKPPVTVAFDSAGDDCKLRIWTREGERGMLVRWWWWWWRSKVVPVMESIGVEEF